MQVSVENVGALGRKLTVSVPAERLESAISARLGELSRTVQLKGFRRGKVPARVIEQRYGRQVRGEAMSELIGASFSEAVDRESLRPAAAPEIETSGKPEDGEFKFVATFEVVPDFGPIDVSDLPIVKMTATVEESDVDAMIETLRVQRRKWIDVERPAQAGDLVAIESHALLNGERRPATGVDKANTVIGSGALLPSVEEGLIGIAVGEERTISYMYPADWGMPELAGKPAELTAKATRVAEAALPEVDAEFIASFGVVDGDLERFRKEVRANLERELKRALMIRLRVEVAKKLAERYADVEVPRNLVVAEADKLAKRVEEQARQQGQQNVSVSPEAFEGQAKRHVTVGLVLSELARQQSLRLDPRGLEEALSMIASTYEEPDQVVELYRNDERLLNGLRAQVFEEQVMDWIAEHARLEIENHSFSDVMKAVRAA